MKQLDKLQTKVSWTPLEVTQLIDSLQTYPGDLYKAAAATGKTKS